MIFVAITDGGIPIVHPFIDDEGRLASVNGAVYLELLRDIVWPQFRFSASRRNLWWMQDGALPHTISERFLKIALGASMNGHLTDLT